MNDDDDNNETWTIVVRCRDTGEVLETVEVPELAEDYEQPAQPEENK